LLMCNVLSVISKLQLEYFDNMGSNFSSSMFLKKILYDNRKTTKQCDEK
jgi:hypothetical protein